MIMLEPETLDSQLSRLDPKALARLHDRYYPVVFRYVAYRLQNIRDVEDLVSDVFVSLLDAIQKRPDSIRDIRSWLLGAASNKINDLFRQKYKHPNTEMEDLEYLPDGNSVEQSTEEKIRLQQIQTSMRSLTEEQQHVLALRFSQELSLEETAQIMGKTVGAVKVLQFRAIDALRRKVEGMHV